MRGIILPGIDKCMAWFFDSHSWLNCFGMPPASLVVFDQAQKETQKANAYLKQIKAWLAPRALCCFTLLLGSCAGDVTRYHDGVQR